MKQFLATTMILFSLFLQAGEKPAYSTGEIHTIPSDILGEQRSFSVQLPAEYHRGDAHYPVFYLLDGEVNFPHVTANLTYLSRGSLIPQMIVVAIHNTNRTRDMTPQPKFPGEIGLPPEDMGGLDAFNNFMEKELFPYVEKTWRTEPFRVLSGHSLGGLVTLHTLFNREDLFDAYIAVSPSMPWDKGILVKQAEAWLQRKPGKRKWLYTTMGEEDPIMVKLFGDLNNTLTIHQRKDFLWSAHNLKGEDHDSGVPLGNLQAIRWLFEGWRPAQNDLMAMDYKTLETYYANNSRKYGFPVRIPYW